MPDETSLFEEIRSLVPDLVSVQQYTDICKTVGKSIIFSIPISQRGVIYGNEV